MLIQRISSFINSLGLRLPSKKEWLFVNLTALFFALLLALPNLVGFFAANPLHVTWSSYVNNHDLSSYVDVIWQARRGHILFNNNLTAEINPHVLLRPLFLLMGWFSFITRIKPYIVFFIFRLLVGAGLTYALYFVVSQFFSKIKERRLALITLLTSGGLESVFFFFINYWGKLPIPLSVRTQEANTFTASINNPLFVYSLGLLVLIAVIIWKAKYRSWWVSGLLAVLAFLLTLEHPYDVPIIIFLGGLGLTLALVYRRNIIHLIKINLGLVVGVALGALGIAQAYLRSPAIKSWNQYNLLYPPPFGEALLSYGLLMILALVGLYRYYKNRDVLFLVLWFLGQLGLVYFSHLFFALRLFEGLHISITLIAVFGILALSKRAATRYLIVGILSLATVASIGFRIYLHGGLYVDNPIRKFDAGATTFVFDDNYGQAFRWLEKNLKNDLVLASPTNNNLIMTLAGKRVFGGHWSQTIDRTTKVKLMHNFYAGRLSAPDQLFYRYGVDYVFIAREEKKYMQGHGQTVQDILPGLKPVFSNPEVKIFAVHKGS